MPQTPVVFRVCQEAPAFSVMATSMAPVNAVSGGLRRQAKAKTHGTETFIATIREYTDMAATIETVSLCAAYGMSRQFGVLHQIRQSSSAWSSYLGGRGLR